MNNLLGANKFKFTLTGTRFKNNNFEPSIYSINVPGLQLGISPQPSTIRSIPRPGDSIEFDELTIGFLLQEDISDWLTIFNWISDIKNFANTTQEEIFSEGKLILLTNKNNPNIQFTFEQMFPISLSSIPLNNSESTQSIQIDASFKYVNMIVNNL